MELKCWHYQIDTLPRLESAGDLTDPWIAADRLRRYYSDGRAGQLATALVVYTTLVEITLSRKQGTLSELLSGRGRQDHTAALIRDLATLSGTDEGTAERVLAEFIQLARSDTFDLRVPLGLWSDTPQPLDIVNVILEIWLDDRPSFRIGFDQSNVNGFVRRITPLTIAELRSAGARALRWYLEMEENVQRSPANQYFEAIVRNIPKGTTVRYSVKVLPQGQVSRQLGPYCLQATLPPEFDDKDIIAMSEGSAGDDVFALYFRPADGSSDFHWVRADLLDIATTQLNFDLQVGDRRYTLSDKPFRPELLPALPAINPFADYVVVAIPKATIPDVASIRWRGVEYDVHAKRNVGQARLMFIQFCIQGLNDLFELPEKSYNPPRTYMQLTMRDELARFSSRPDSLEGGHGDGYLYTLEAHDRYQLPYLWAFNGGVLALIAHDCRPDLDQIKRYIEDGIMSPAIAGFGSHRLPYYQEETNRYAIRFGIDIIRNLLDNCNDVYYPDSRVYKQISNVIGALKSASVPGNGDAPSGQVRYLVVDGSTGFTPYEKGAELSHYWRDRIVKGQHYLWRDRESGLYLLFIDDELRDKMVGSSDRESARGKLAKDLRRKLFQFASDPRRRKHLLIYSDDCEKASGNGWFDGTYSGYEIDFRAKYQASLEWIAAHRWISAITTKELNLERQDEYGDCVGYIDMRTAIDPSIDPCGVRSWDCYGKEIHFDAWYDNWKLFRSPWLDRSLEELSQSVEYAIIDWPGLYRNKLYQLGQMAFAMALHESQWNKQPLEYIDGRNPNQRRDVVEPEDFVIAATLQLRNAQVYLNAAVWAAWATGAGGQDADVYLNDGEVIALLSTIRYNPNGDAGRDARYVDRRILDDPLCWDRDLLRNVVLYNREVLVVMDRNGGRITHLFAMHQGEPVCVSGTFKTYQFLSGERASGANVVCDGEVLQNTVYTPNHAYIACDVRESLGVIGTKYDPRTGVNGEVACYYPDNFNAYTCEKIDAQTVEWRYEQTGPMPMLDLALFRKLLLEDRTAKVTGREGLVYHPSAPFRKQIALEGRNVTVRYFGAPKGHIVANEFCIDLHAGVMHGKRTHPSAASATERIVRNDGGSVRLSLGNNCEFSTDTCEGERNRRLHRVLTDCLEVTAREGGDFSYVITIAP